MKSLATSKACIRQLKDLLGIRLANSALTTLRVTADADGWNELFISNGSEAAGAQVMFVKIACKIANGIDVFGNANVAFAPHQLTFAYEQDANGKPIVDSALISTVLVELGKYGFEIHLKELANTVAVTDANVEAAATAAVIPFDVLWASSSR